MTNIVTDIKNNWVLVMVVVGLIVTWTTNNLRLSIVEAKQVEIETISQKLEMLNTNVYLLCISSGIKCKE